MKIHSSHSNILTAITKAATQSALAKKLSPAKKKRSTRFKVIITILASIFALLTLAFVATSIPAFSLKSQIPGIESSARSVLDSIKSQNLPQAKENLSQLHTKLTRAQSTYKFLAWYQFTPLRGYYSDGDHLFQAVLAGISAGQTTIDTLEPYADVIGFEGEGSFTGGTAQERILRIIQTLKDISPSLESIIADLTITRDQLAHVNPHRYQIQLQDYQLDQLIIQGQDLSVTAVSTVSDLKPLLEVLPTLAGLEAEQKYLMLFQNDAEIRPTGGFMTAYGVIRVEKGTIHQEKSDDIYTLDNKFNSRIEPPQILRDKLKMYYWNLRDMNFSPDFKTSMDLFLSHYLTIPSEPSDLDGVIAVDTQVLSDLITVLGPVEVPGFGTFTAEIDPRCDCPQVIYELEDFSTRPVAYVRDDRKAFLVPLMQTLILKAYGAPHQVWPSLFQTILKNIQQKHVLFYMQDESAQTAIESAGFGGRVTHPEGDYLLVVDANLGGGKANLFITQDVQLSVTPADTGYQHQLTISYDNPAPASNCDPEAGKLCLNPEYRGYTRFYFPLGTTLDEALGFEADSLQEFEELDKHVVAGFFRFQPESRAKIKLTYTTPAQTQPYQLTIQKQPGQKLPTYTVLYNDQQKQEFILSQDKTLQFDP